MVSNIIVKTSRRELDCLRRGQRNTVTLPCNPHWKRKLQNPATGRYYRELTVIVRSYEKDPRYVISARSGGISLHEGGFTIELKGIHVLLPPFSRQLIEEPRRNSIK
ncbi:MAG: hypothetical protein LUE10_02710 [Alistipes sp.]|nr:hypothetical protein [Alistipes sp.]